ncbi:hypothetical protein ACLMJK_008857 [Lecanora helva]
MAECGHVEDKEPATRQLPLIWNETVPSDADKLSWTSARCNRLLRPLSSKIALLRKEKGLENQLSERTLHTSNASIAGSNSSERNRYDFEKFASQSRSISIKDEDREWEPSPRPRKKVKRTYSSKTKVFLKESTDKAVGTSFQPCPQNAVIDLPQHLLHGARPDNQALLDDDADQKLPQSQRSSLPVQGLPKDSVQSNWKLVDGVCKAFVALLRSTLAPKRCLPPSGCRSLFSTCIRQVPQYIAEEEAIAKIDDPDNDDDVSTRIYNDLEEYGSTPNSGWEPLRLLVRAHGVRLIIDAIRESVLSLSVAKHLYYLCLDVSADKEADDILESLIGLAKLTQDLSPNSVSPAPYDAHLALHSLSSQSCNSWRKRFLYRHSAAMLESGILAPEWISRTLTIGTWNSVIQSIIKGDGDAQSANLLLHTAVSVSLKSVGATPRQDVHELRLRIHRATHRPMLRSSNADTNSASIDNVQPKSRTTKSSLRRGSENGPVTTLSSLLTVFTVIARLETLSSATYSDGLSSRAVPVLHELSVRASQIIELSSQPDDIETLEKPGPDALSLPLLAAGVVELSSLELDQEICHPRLPSLEILARISLTTEVFRGGASFLCAVARCCGKSISEDPFDIMKTLVRDLIMASKSDAVRRPIREFCKDLALTAAFTYSEDTSRPIHLDWALHVESSLTSKGSGSTPRAATIKTPVRTSLSDREGFRWEEGICEWIVKTPALSLRKSTEINSRAADSEKISSNACDSIKPMLPPPPLLSNKSSSMTNSSIGPTQASPKHVSAKAVQVLIQVKTGSPSKSVPLRDLGPKRPPIRKSSRNLKQTVVTPSQDEHDESSTLEAESRKPSALSTLPELPNVALGTKRKQDPKAQQRPGFNSTQVRAEKPDCSLDIADIDELALMFKW